MPLTQMYRPQEDPYGSPSSLTGGYPTYDRTLPSLGPTKNYSNNDGGLGSLLGSSSQYLAKSELGKKALAKAGKGIAGKLASKGGLLGKLGKGATSSPTPWAIGGTAASLLGNKIAQKHAKTGSFLGGAGSGAALGASIGSVIPGIGTAIGGVAGGLIGGIKGLFKGKKMNKAKKEQAALALTEGAPGARGVVKSDPYGQLRAETEARYSNPQPFDYMGSYNKLMQNFPAAGGQDYVRYAQQKAEPYMTGEGMGGLSTFGG